MNRNTAKTVKAIINKFADLNGASFVAIKEYESSTTGEVANHVVNANWSYGNAVDKDLKALKNATETDIETIAKIGNFTPDLVKLAIAKLTASFENNKNAETASAQSTAQTEVYLPITNSIKLHIETGKLYIHAMAVNKQVLVAGTYKVTNSRELTLCQNAVKKHFNFSTAKYRNFIINPEQLAAVTISGEKYELK